MTYVGRTYDAGNSGIGWALQNATRQQVNACMCDAGKLGGDAEQIVRMNKNIWSVARGSNAANLAAPTRDSMLASRRYLIGLLEWAEKFGFNAVLIYAGKQYGDITDPERRVISSLRAVLHQYTGDVEILLSNHSDPHTVGKLSSLRRIISQVDDPRLGICMDTLHAAASGYLPFDIESMADEARMLLLTPPAMRQGKLDRGSFSYSTWPLSQLLSVARAYKFRYVILNSTDGQADLIRLRNGIEALPVETNTTLDDGESHDLRQVDSV